MIWIDAQISPAIAPWIRAEFALDAVAVRDLELRDAEDLDIFLAAKKANAVVITKDRDFVDLLDRLRAAENNLAHLRQHLQRQVERNSDLESFQRLANLGKR